MIFGYGNIIITFLFLQSYFELMIDAKIDGEQVVQLPAKLIVLYRRHDAEQSCIAEKRLSKIMIVDG